MTKHLSIYYYNPMLQETTYLIGKTCLLLRRRAHLTLPIKSSLLLKAATKTSDAQESCFSDGAGELRNVHGRQTKKSPLRREMHEGLLPECV